MLEEFWGEHFALIQLSTKKLKNHRNRHFYYEPSEPSNKTRCQAAVLESLGLFVVYAAALEFFQKPCRIKNTTVFP